MRRIVNLFISMGIIALAALVFPEKVVYDGFWNLLLAAVLIWLVSCGLALLFTLILGVGAACENVAWIILAIIGILVSQALAILLASHWLNGFYVANFWLALLMSVVIMVFQIGKPKSSDDD